MSPAKSGMSLQGQSDNSLNKYIWHNNFSFHLKRLELSGQPLHARVTLKVNVPALLYREQREGCTFLTAGKGEVILTQWVLKHVINSKEQSGSSVPSGRLEN